ncbi:MAG: GHKL domain-containing protein [Streptococcaceae bacterium]|jgi:two-component system sensor histidine kinase AgrC|nr:GHKL domain-containing protein [Streptococcaceae bacterium]
MDNVIVIGLQIFLVWSVYYGISKQKISVLGVLSSILYFSIAATLLGNYSMITIFPFFYIYSKHVREPNMKQLTFFYSIYTASVSLLLLNFPSLFFYEFSSSTVLEGHALIFGIISIVLAVILHYIALRLFKIDMKLLKNEDEFIKKKIIAPLNRVLLFCLFLFLVVYFYESYFVRESPIAEYSKYVFFIFFFMFISIMAYISDKLRSYLQLEVQRSKDQQLQQLDLYTNEIELMYQTLKGFRHDYANILISLKESIDSREINQVKKVYNDILISANLKLVNQTEHTNINELSNIKNSALKSVLFWKLTEARKNNVEISIEIKEAIVDLKIEILDFIRIISILMDNAIEAASKCSKPLLELAFLKDGQNVIVIIRNSNSMMNIPIGRLFEADYSTKGADRGTGLFNVKTILATYNFASIDTEVSDNLFTQTITIRM